MGLVARHDRPAGGYHQQLSIDEQIELLVTRSVEAVLAPYLGKLAQPEPLVYTVTQAAAALQVSNDTVGRLVRRGVLPRVPHLDGKLLIPRAAVQQLVINARSKAAVGEADADVSEFRSRGEGVITTVEHPVHHLGSRTVGARDEVSVCAKDVGLRAAETFRND